MGKQICSYFQGVIRCHIESNPPIQFVTWTKNKRIFDPFEQKGVMAIENGSIVIDKVGFRMIKKQLNLN